LGHVNIVTDTFNCSVGQLFDQSMQLDEVDGMRAEQRALTSNTRWQVIAKVLGTMMQVRCIDQQRTSHIHTPKQQQEVQQQQQQLSWSEVDALLM
jgi:hypothetical protein